MAESIICKVTEASNVYIPFTQEDIFMTMKHGKTLPGSHLSFPFKIIYLLNHGMR
jgi:hypothetical protein